MIKAYAFLKRRPDLSAADFHVHWATAHREHALAIDRICRYVQAHVIDEPVPGFAPAPVDGIPEVWLADLESAASLRDDPAHRSGARLDEPQFIDMDAFMGMRTMPRLVLEARSPDREPAAVKAILLLRAGGDDGMSSGTLAACTAQVARETGAFRALCAVAVPSEAPPPFDAVTELWFTDLDAFRAGWNDGSAARSALTGDATGAANPARSEAVLVRELRARWPGTVHEPVQPA